MEYRMTVSLLCELYHPLLTEWQTDVVTLYYDHDLSLAEIAQLRGVTRTAVHSTLKRAEKVLEAYEARLGLLKAYRERRQVAEELEGILASCDDERRHQAMALVRKLYS